ncbi:MAG TPA: 50S ribosomal protein L33 [Polyangiaceae bacterium]|nr:50S ribosomal protein L33 [Polyangiaceae bacterium]
MVENWGSRRTSKTKRIPIALCCRQCGTRNYKTTRTSNESTPGLTLKKFCKHCNAHTEHHESR